MGNRNIRASGLGEKMAETRGIYAKLGRYRAARMRRHGGSLFGVPRMLRSALAVRC
jgi:hypothetical protein